MYNHLPVTSVFKTTQIHIYAVSLTLFLCSRELSRSDSCACGVRDLICHITAVFIAESMYWETEHS